MCSRERLVDGEVARPACRHIDVVAPVDCTGKDGVYHAGATCPRVEDRSLSSEPSDLGEDVGGWVYGRTADRSVAIYHGDPWSDGVARRASGEVVLAVVHQGALMMGGFDLWRKKGRQRTRCISPGDRVVGSINHGKLEEQRSR